MNYLTDLGFLITKIDFMQSFYAYKLIDGWWYYWDLKRNEWVSVFPWENPSLHFIYHEVTFPFYLL